MNIYIDSDKEIDFTILNKKMEKTEKRETTTISDVRFRRLIEQNSLTEEEYELIQKRIRTHNLQLDWRKVYTTSKSGARQHALGDLYNSGYLYQWGYTLVETNLATCFLQIIKLISKLNEYDIPDCEMNVDAYADKLDEFFSGRMGSDKEVQNLLINLAENNSFLTTYIDKAIQLSSKSDIITIDAFNITRRYKKLYPIEAITIPISFSLNSLIYAMVEGMKDRFRRGEKRFGCVHNYKLYHFIRNDVVDKYLGLKFYIDGVPLNIKHKVITLEEELLTR